MQPMAKTELLQLNYKSPRSLHVKSDQKKIERIARNLILNALKYAKEGHVEVKCEKISEDHWMLEVSDTGPGLDVTHAKTLTTDDESSNEQGAYTDTDEFKVPSEAEKHGEGIGLLIVRHYADF